MAASAKSGKHLVLFLSNGGSLCAWEKANILSREIALYLEFLKADHLQQVTVFSCLSPLKLCHYLLSSGVWIDGTEETFRLFPISA